MQTSSTDPDYKAVQEKVVARRFDDALADLATLLRNDPNDPELLYMSAVCRRYTGRFDAALEDLSKLREIAPEHGRAHQEEGHAYRDMGRPDDALRAYVTACSLNPALEASWRGQLEILTRKGLKQQAMEVSARLERLRGLPRPLVGVMDLIGQGRLPRAEDICRRFLLKVPHHVEAMRLLADIGMRLGVLDDAELLLEGALEIEPDNPQLRIDYIQVLRKRQKFRLALEQAGQLLREAPQNPRSRSLFAVVSMQAGDYRTALSTFDAVLDQVPGDPATLTAKGHAYKTLGKYESAVGAYRAALKSEPRYGEAWYSLANLKVYTFDDDEIRDMLVHESDNGLARGDRVYFCFALGKACEDRREFERSFGYYERGNRLKKAQSRYDAGQMSADLAAQRDVCTAEFFDRRSGAGFAAPDPIFIVGLPRAGSTLLEQILSSHSQVDGTLELPNVLALSQRLRRQGRRRESSAYPAMLRDLPAGDFENYGRQFLADTQIHRHGAAYFIDKMPNNFRHIGLIHLMLPNSKVIDARREPMACCFSGFKQLFAEGQEFSYDLGDIGRYYRDYVELMDHWDAVLPGKVLRVQYEDVVTDLETQVRRLLDFCGLPFEPACVDYYRTERAVRTPSSEQVRQPIFTSGLEQWRNFEPHLAPLKTALGPVLDRYPAAPDG